MIEGGEIFISYYIGIKLMMSLDDSMAKDVKN